MAARSLSTVRVYLRDLSALTRGRFSAAATLLAVNAALEFASLALLWSLLHAAGLSTSTGATPAFPFGGPNLAFGPALAAFAVIKLLQLALRLWSQHLTAWIDQHFSAALRERHYRALAEASWRFSSQQRSSDITQAQLEEIPRAARGASHLLTLAGTGTTAAVQTLIAFWLAPAFTLGLLAAGVAIALGWRTWQRREHAQLDRQPVDRADLAAAVTEHLGAMKIAKSYGRSAWHLSHFRGVLEQLSAHALRAQRRHAVLRGWAEGAATVALAGFVFAAVEWRPVGPGPLLLLAFIFARLLAQANQLQTAWQHFALSLPSYFAIEEQRARYAAAAEPLAPNDASRLALQHELRFERVTFRYQPARDPALDRIDLVLPARQVTALCGRSGAGKSTLADLALGLLPPDSGRVLVDGAPLTGDSLPAWRASIGYVPQETFLFHDTVRANLLWANPAATAADLREALRAAAAEDFVNRLPQGLDTIVGDRGQRLSGGERQRLALARALLRRPTLLVLDEATSSLDPHNERLVQDAIERLHGETTILLIAHRLSTVRAADRVVVLDHGRIAETGTWQELAAREHGAFRALLAADARA